MVKCCITILTNNRKDMIDLISKWAKSVPILSLLVLFMFFTFFLFPKYSNQLNEIAGEQVQILDKYLNYTKAQVTDLFTKIKAEGRDLHHFITSCIDMIYPLVYGPFLMLLTAFFMRKVNPKIRRGLFFAFLIPFLLMLIDYAENFTTLQLLSSFPNLDDRIINRGSKLANLKLILILISLGMVLFSALFWLLQYVLEATFSRQRR